MCSPQHTIYRFVCFLVVWTVSVAVSLSGQERHRVAEVIDGELLRVTGIGTVRLLGVDVPKSANGLRPWTAETDETVLFLRALLAAQPVQLEYDRVRTDSAKITVAYVYLSNGTLLNAEVLKRGFGRLNPEVPFSRVEEFRKYQHEAQTAQRGLWATTTSSAHPTERPSADVMAPPRPPGAPGIR